MPIPYRLSLQIKHYTPSEGKFSMVLYSPFEEMNTPLTFSTEIYYNMVAIFVFKLDAEVLVKV